MHDHMEKAWLDLDYAPKLPRDKMRGIGIVGAGTIVQACHLPAYRMAGVERGPSDPKRIGRRIPVIERKTGSRIARKAGLDPVEAKAAGKHPDPEGKETQ